VATAARLVTTLISDDAAIADRSAFVPVGTIAKLLILATIGIPNIMRIAALCTDGHLVSNKKRNASEKNSPALRDGRKGIPHDGN
jgi:hypothetical protein